MPNLSIIWLDEVDSTNFEAQRRLSAEGTLVVAALNQTSGKGQGEHKWHSAPGENLTFTFARQYPPQEAPKVSDEARVSFGTALGVVDYLGSKGIEARIKLQNDIYVGTNKICGLLIKHQVRNSHLLNSIIGIGLNVNESAFPSDIPNPTSMLLETGKRYDIKEELEILLSFLEKRLDLSLSLRSLEKEFNSLLVPWQK